MKSFVFMNRKTGALFIAYRIAFMDAMEPVPEAPAYAISVNVLMQGGWLIEHPKFRVSYFMNMNGGELIFENLGEL